MTPLQPLILAAFMLCNENRSRSPSLKRLLVGRIR